MATSNKRQLTVEILGDAKSLTQSAQMAERELAKLEAIKLGTKKLGVDFDTAEVQQKLARLDALKQAKLVVALDMDVAKAERELDKLGTSSSEAFKAKWQSVGDSLASTGQRLSVGLTAPIVGAFGLATKAAAEYEDQLNVVAATFGPLQSQVLDFAETATSQFGLSKREAIEVASAFGGILDRTKLSKQEVADFSTKLTGLAGDLSSFFGKSTEQASNAIRSGLLGESEPLKQFNIVLSEAAVKAKAYASGIAEAGKELTESQKVQARYALIVEQSTKVQGDFAKTADSSVNAAKSAQKEIENAGVALGSILTPALAVGAKGLSGLARGFQELPKEAQVAIVAFGGLVAALGPVLTVTGNVMRAVAGMREGLDKLRGADGGLNNVGKALAGLSIATSVVGGVVLVRKAIEELQDKADAKRVQEWVNAFAGIGDIKVADVVEKSLNQFDDLPAKIDLSKISIADLKKELATFSSDPDDFPILSSLNLSTKEMQKLRTELGDAIGQFDKIKRTVQEMLVGPAGLERVSKMIAALKAGGAPEFVTNAVQKQLDDYVKLLATGAKEAEASQKKLAALTGTVEDQTEAVKESTKTWEEQRLEYARMAKSFDDANSKVTEARQKIEETRKAGEASIKEAVDNRTKVIEEGRERYEAALEREREVAAQTSADIAKAERAVADAIKDGAADVAKAKQAWADAVIDANSRLLAADAEVVRVQQENARDIKAAEDAARDAEQDAINRTVAASWELTNARIEGANRVQAAIDDQVRTMEQANDRIADAELAKTRTIEDSALRVADAQRDASRAYNDAVRAQVEATQDAADRIADAEARVAEVAEQGAERVKAAKESAAQAAENAAERIAATEKSAADQVKSSDKSVASARKDRDKAVKESTKDVAEAEKSYQEALRKSGPNSEAARNAAERLADARERATERVADAEERLREAVERAAEARAKAEADVAKAKADAAKAEVDNAKKVEQAEKDAAKAKKDAEGDLQKARDDAAQAQIDAAQRVAQALEDGQLKIAAAERQRTRDVDDAEANLAGARKERDAAQIASDAAVATARNEATERIGKAEAGLRAAQAEQESARIKGQGDIATAVEQAAEREKRAKGEAAAAAVAKATAETKAADDVKAAEKAADDERKASQDNLKTVIDESEKANRKAFEDTRTVVQGNLEKIKEATDKVGKARTQAAKDAKGAEDDLLKALEDQRLEYIKLDAEWSKQKLGFTTNVDAMIGKVGQLGTAILNLPPLPSVPGAPGGGDGDGGDGSGSGGDGGDGGVFAVDENGNVVRPDFIVEGAGAAGTTGFVNAGTTPASGVNGFVGASPAGQSDGSGGTQFNSGSGTGSGASGSGASGSGASGAGSSGSSGSGASSGGTSAGAAAAGGGGASGPIATVIAFAKAQVGKPYVYGAKGPDAYDCSGLTWRSYKQIGVDIGQGTAKQISAGTGVPKSQIRAGDLVFWRGGKDPHDNGHVVLAISSTQCVNAPRTGAKVQINTIDLGKVQNVRRIIGATASVSGSQAGEAARAGATTASGSSGGGSGSASTAGGPPETSTDLWAKEQSRTKPGEWAGRNYIYTDGRIVGRLNGTNSGGAGVDASFMESVAASGGIATNIGGTSTVSANGIVATTGPASVSAGGGVTVTAPNGIVATTGTASVGAGAEQAIAIQRQQGLQIEARVQARRVEMLRLEELATKLRAEQAAQAQGITDQATLQRLSAETAAASVAASAATEARIAADRAAGVAVEQTAAAKRRTGAELEAEILRLRVEAEKLTGTAANAAATTTVGASVAAGQVLVDAANAVGHTIGDAVAHAAAGVVGGKKPGFFDGVYTWFADGTYTPGDVTGTGATTGTESSAVWAQRGAWTGPNYTVAPPVWWTDPLPGPAPADDIRGDVTIGGSSVGDSRVPDTSGSDTVTQVVQAPFIITLDGKALAEGIYEYSRQVARRNGDRTADGGWRVSRR